MIYLFKNTRTVITAEKKLRENGIAVEIMPTPRTLSTECGMSIIAADSYAQQIELILTDACIDFEKHPWSQGDRG